MAIAVTDVEHDQKFQIQEAPSSGHPLSTQLRGWFDPTKAHLRTVTISADWVFLINKESTHSTIGVFFD